MAQSKSSHCSSHSPTWHSSYGQKNEQEQERNGCGDLGIENPSSLIEKWWSTSSTIATISSKTTKVEDPFGVISWPGSIIASRELAQQHASSSLSSPILDSTVLILGAGTGVEAHAAALLGAKHVLATDVNPLSLALLEYGIQQSGLNDVVHCQEFDLCSDENLPESDIVIIADVLYNQDLAKQVGRRCQEILLSKQQNNNNKKRALIVTDSQRFHGTDFVPALNRALQSKLNANGNDDGINSELLTWEEYFLKGFTGSGILIPEDQTYDVHTRMLSVGWS